MRAFLFVVIFCAASTVHSADHKFLGQDYPPLNFEENSKVIGAMVELIEGTCAKISEKCSFEIQPLKRAALALESGEVAGIMTLVQNKERDAIADFIPIYKANQVYWSQDKAAPLAKLEDLKGKTTVAVSSSASLKLANEHAAAVGGVTVTEESNNETIMKKLSGGRYGDNAEALVNEVTGKLFIERLGIKNLKIAYVIKSETYGIYFPKKNQDADFFAKFSKQLEISRKAGAIKKLLDKYSIEAI